MEYIVMKLLNVAFFCDFFNSLGGTELYNFNLIKNLNDMGIEAQVFILEKPVKNYWLKKLDEMSVKYHISEMETVHSMDPTQINSFITIIDKVFKDLPPDIIYVNPVGYLAKEWIEEKGSTIPIVATEWTTPGRETINWYPPNIKEIINGIDTIIATCEASKRGIREYFNYKGRVVTIPHIIDSNKIVDLREEVGSYFSFGCIARLSIEKGIHFLIASFRIVVDTYREATLHIYGAGDEKKSLENLIVALNLQENVFLKGTFLGNAEYANILKTHRLFCQPSLFESIPTSLIELVLSRKTVIATDVGGVSELIGEEIGTGYLVKPYHVEALALKIIEVIASIEKHGQLNLDPDFEEIANKYNTKINLMKILETFEMNINRKGAK